ncbi:uL30 family ribosomal protein [Candidatus Parvarchaeota archaeon]|nr:uL30 family ribosomal protein [Candidatus Parvarchaeota archaeon]
MTKLCALKIRTSIKKSRTVQRSLRTLGLKKLYSCTLLNDTDSVKGILKAAESTMTYGEINKETLKKLLLRRSKISNSKKYEWTEEQLDKFAQDIIDGKSDLKQLKIKNVFNLHPPIHGFDKKGKKAPFSVRGSFGYRGEKINKLLERMI